MKKILILSCSTGEGHNSAARAIKTVLTKKGYMCEIADPVSFQSERAKRMVSSIYNKTIKKAPRVFGAVYKLGNVYSSSKHISPVYKLNAHYSEYLRRYIVANNFDAVVCTHLYGMEAMTAIKKRSGTEIPCYGVLTDYVVIPFLDETSLTGYFVPNEKIKNDLIEKGVAAEKIFTTGIPVDEAFVEKPEKTEARKKLGISDDKKVFLIMTGGIGCENMEGLCAKLMRRINDDGIVYVLTGRNDDLKEKLDKKFRNDERLKTVTFTRDVVSYMSAADVMLSKPGGLSSTEAAVANVPQVHIHAIPGCETYNARFFSENGMALWAKNEHEAVEFATHIAYNPDVAEKMCEMQRKFINPDAAEDIVQKVIS